MWLSGYHFWLWFTRSQVWIPLKAEFSLWLYVTSLLRTFHYHSSVILIWLKWCWKGCKTPMPSCSKLTTSLVNDSLKFTSSDTQICWNFLLKKSTHIFSAKNIRILYIESAKTVNEMTLNDLLMLMMLWQLGPNHQFLFKLMKTPGPSCSKHS